MTVNEYLASNAANYAVRDKITCTSGLVLSVQASIYHYCTPRDNSGPWSHVEVGFPSREIKEILRYAEGYAPRPWYKLLCDRICGRVNERFNPTGCVYGWVPVEVLDAVIAKNGGITNTPRL